MVLATGPPPAAGATGASSLAPQFPQNLFSTGSSVPQLGQSLLAILSSRWCEAASLRHCPRCRAQIKGEVVPLPATADRPPAGRARIRRATVGRGRCAQRGGG